MDSVQVHQGSPLDGMKISGQKMTTPRMVNGYDEEDNNIELNSRPYVSFVGTAPTVEKLYSNLREQQRLDGLDNGWCCRYDEHMKLFEHKAKHGMAPKQLQPEYSFINRIMALKKKEALRKKAQEQLEQRKQRKIHSSPLYSSINERKHKVRFQMPRLNKLSPRSPRESVVKEQQDFQKSWDDEVNTEDMKEREITNEIPDVKESSSSETDLDSSTKVTEEVEEKVKEEEPKPVVKSQSEIDREKGYKKVEISQETKKKEKQEPKKVKKAPKKEAHVKPVAPEKEVKPSRSKTKSLTKVKSKSSRENFKEEKIDLEDCGTLISEDTSHSIATIEDTKTGPLSLTVAADKPQTPEPSSPTQPRRRSIVKKVFVPKVRPKSERSESPPTPVVEEEKPVTPEVEEPVEIAEIPTVEPKLPQVELNEPPLPDPSLIKAKETKGPGVQRSVLQPVLKLEQKLKQQRQFKRDTSYEDELRRQEEAERRRQKQMEMLERMKSRKNRGIGEVDTEDEARRFDNYGFLAKYCIFSKGSMDAYRRTFESVDEERRGWIQGVEVMIALRGINQNISYSEEEYLYRVLEIAGYNVSQGADFKLFAVMAALSLKISALDSWMKNMIGSMDFKTLDTKMYMCKKLWECNVDPDTNRIPLDQLCIELRAGGISPEHEAEVREKLGHLKSLDLLDFLTYIPLFIMIHESVVDNPFDERREK